MTTHSTHSRPQRSLNPTTLAVASVLGGLLLGSRLAQRTHSLAGQRVLITGGSRGLGLALAECFAQAGCSLALCARTEAELERAAARLRPYGVPVVTVPCDVGDRIQVERMVAQVTQRLGAIDILVNNAGIIQVGPYATLTLQDFEQAQATIFWGAVYTTLAVVPQMQARGAGRIVNITSLGGRVSIPHLLPYTSAKFALVGFSEGLTAELAPYGIRVTTVVPGLMRTGSYLQAFFKGQRAQEFSWFSPVASWPFFSIGVEQAARQIVEATRRGAAQCTLTIPAHLLSWLHGLLPGPTVQMFALANRLMPQATESAAAPQRGMEVRADLPTGVRRVVDAVTPLGRQAAARYQHVEVG